MLPSQVGAPVESLNNMLFLTLNAQTDSPAWVTGLALLLGEHAIWLVPGTLVLGWMRGKPPLRRLMLEASIAGLVGLLLNQLIGLTWTHPRPFVVGLGHTLISHVPDSSFPSDHLTLWWSVAFSFMLNEGTRRLGMLAGLIGIPMAWARIYLGVHFPLDMLGALCVSSSAAWLTHHKAGALITTALGRLVPIHRRFLGPLIRKGWLEP